MQHGKHVGFKGKKLARRLSTKVGSIEIKPESDDEPTSTAKTPGCFTDSDLLNLFDSQKVSRAGSLLRVIRCFLFFDEFENRSTIFLLFVPVHSLDPTRAVTPSDFPELRVLVSQS